MSNDLIRYDLLVQDALRSVVRKILTDVVKDGILGDHHFYISFRTDFPDTRVSQRLREKYPEEMTIVLQHQFWDLGVTDYAFEVGLSFSGVPERLLVPFEALTGFFDPSVQFGLKFETTTTEVESEPLNAKSENGGFEGNMIDFATSRNNAKKSGAKSENAQDTTSNQTSVPSLPKQKSGKAKPDTKADISAKAEAKTKTTKASKSKEAEKASGADILSLDAFRKKT